MFIGMLRMPISCADPLSILVIAFLDGLWEGPKPE